MTDLHERWHKTYFLHLMICEAAATVLEQNALIFHFYKLICSVIHIFEQSKRAHGEANFIIFNTFK
jgi:hypothetical protein